MKNLMTIEKYKTSRYWAVRDERGRLICITVYKKGAQEVVTRLLAAAGLFAQ